jgi:ankyrin repeat protein
MLDPRLGQTALHFAAWAGRVEVVKRLLTAGTMMIIMTMMRIMTMMKRS